MSNTEIILIGAGMGVVVLGVVIGVLLIWDKWGSEGE